MKSKFTFLKFTIWAAVFMLQSCESKQTEEQIVQQENPIKETVVDSFQHIINSNQVSGSILIYDVQKSEYFSNDFERTEIGFLPASTFKIPNSIIGLETGVLKDEKHLFKWDGKPRRLKQWEADLTLAQAYEVSCVDCYQEVARTIGIERMNDYLKKFDYGNMEVVDSMLDLFWLEGDFKITQKQQIDFLKRFYDKKLPISDRTYNIMRHKIMVLDDNEAYKLSGKTGWAILDGHNLGWFVGFVEVADNIYYFATNVTPIDQNATDNFAKVRIQITLRALEALAIL